MENTQQYRIILSAPNLINICVDHSQYGEINGRMYHCYAEEPVMFQNIIELLREMERVFDAIGFPQASTITRSFTEKNVVQTQQVKKPDKLVAQDSVAGHTGQLATFLVSVRYRQNSTWQGEMFWREQEIVQRFANTLDFIKQIDVIVSKS